MKTDLVRTSDIPGPNISGTVTVPLAELDKMRADHATLKRLAADLESHQMEVKIILANQSQKYESIVGWRTSEEVISETYKNLDEIKDLLRLNLLKEDQIKSDELQRTLEKQMSVNTDNINLMRKSIIERDEVKIKTLALQKEKDTITKERDDLLISVTAMQEKADALDKLNEGFQANIARLSRELEKEKKKKGFWSFLS